MVMRKRADLFTPPPLPPEWIRVGLWGFVPRCQTREGFDGLDRIRIAKSRNLRFLLPDQIQSVQPPQLPESDLDL